MEVLLDDIAKQRARAEEDEKIRTQKAYFVYAFVSLHQSLQKYYSLKTKNDPNLSIALQNLFNIRHVDPLSIESIISF